LEVRSFLFISVLNTVHRFTTTIDILDSIVHWVVEETGDMLLIWANVSGITVEAFTHLEDSSGLAILRPEVLGNLRDGINTDSIEFIFGDKVLDPVLKITSDIIVFLIEIRKISKTAVFDLTLVLPVSDVTFVVIVLGLVQGVDLGVVFVDWCNMVSNNINHDVHAFIMSSLDEGLEVILRTEVRVDLLPVGSPVTVIKACTSWLMLLLTMLHQSTKTTPRSTP
jgi:hypothetical protein